MPDVLTSLPAQRIEELQIQYGEHSHIEGTTSCTAPSCIERWPCWYRRYADEQLTAAGITPRGRR